MTPSSEVEVVLFDLGGVLVEFAGFAAIGEMAGIPSHDDVLHRWITSQWVRAFERGECSPTEFASGMVDEWRLPMSEHEFLTAFGSWLGDLLPGAGELLEETARSARVGCLSNCNVVHWEQHADRYPLLRQLEFSFLSHQLGMVKPDRELFDRVSSLVGVAANRVLFLDDNLANVEGARSAGFRSELARGVDDARTALVAAGVIRHP